MANLLAQRKEMERAEKEVERRKRDEEERVRERGRRRGVWLSRDLKESVGGWREQG